MIYVSQKCKWVFCNEIKQAHRHSWVIIGSQRQPKSKEDRALIEQTSKMLNP